MTPEPLKGKSAGHVMKYDLKSAVEGCLEETLKEIESYERDKIKSIFKKWFEDVM